MEPKLLTSRNELPHGSRNMIYRIIRFIVRSNLATGKFNLSSPSNTMLIFWYCVAGTAIVSLVLFMAIPVNDSTFLQNHWSTSVNSGKALLQRSTVSASIFHIVATMTDYDMLLQRNDTVKTVSCTRNMVQSPKTIIFQMSDTQMHSWVALTIGSTFAERIVVVSHPGRSRM